MTAIEDSERDALTAWVKDKNFSINDLSEVMDMDYSTVYRIVTGQRRVNDGFKWRFAVAFGWQEAEKVFDVSKTPIPELTT